MTNQINPNKLHHSKWSAVQPKDKEKHFIVTELVRDEQDTVVNVVLQAVLTQHERTLHWRELKDDTTWQNGWQ